MKVDVSILADSQNGETGDRLTTFLLSNFPKCLLAELNTHRILSRNAASSRAMPIDRMIEQITKTPFIPQWTAHSKGMVGTDTLTIENRQRATDEWLALRDKAIASVKKFKDLGIAKQNANRALEPWITVPVIVSGTDWDNFFKLRTATDTQPEFRGFACEMQSQMLNSKPKLLIAGDWHIPLSSDNLPQRDRLKSSVAMCARGSYGSFTGHSELSRDVVLHDRLMESGHWSPFEHQAYCCEGHHANYQGWRSYRNMLKALVL